MKTKYIAECGKCGHTFEFTSAKLKKKADGGGPKLSVQDYYPYYVICPKCKTHIQDFELVETINPNKDEHTGNFRKRRNTD